MAQVSRNVLPQKQWNLLWNQLAQIVTAQQSPTQSKVFLAGLLTMTEKIMLAKRLTVCLLLLSGWEAVAIAKQLNMSTSTIYKIKTKFETDSDYQLLLKTEYPKPLPYKKDMPLTVFLKAFIDTFFVSRSERYHQIRRINS